MMMLMIAEVVIVVGFVVVVVIFLSMEAWGFPSFDLAIASGSN